MKKNIIIIASVLVVALAVVAAVFIANKDKKPQVLPDIISPLEQSYVIDKTETSVTVSGMISTPADENPVPDIEDPNYDPLKQNKVVTYIFKDYSYKFAEDGNCYITVDYKKTTDEDVSQEFKFTIKDKKLATANKIFISCNGHTHKIWE